MKEQDTEEKKILNEELFRVDPNDLKNILHRSIVAITFLTPLKQFAVGSGFLISSNLVLTVAHNFYDKKYDQEHEDFKVYCEVKGEIERFYEVESFRYLQSFKSCSKSSRMEYDFALLKLKTSLPFKEYMPLSLICKKCLIENNKKTHLQIFGFPAGCQDGVSGHRNNYSPLDRHGRKYKLHQYGLGRGNRIVSIEPEKFTISYAISTFPGQSGSSVCIGDKIIAIHNGGGKEYENFNVGRIITIDLIMTLEQWNKQLKGNSFSKIQYLPCPHKHENELRAMIERQNFQLRYLRKALSMKQQENQKLKEQQRDSEEVKCTLLRKIQELQPQPQPIRAPSRNGNRQRIQSEREQAHFMTQRSTYIRDVNKQNLLEPIQYKGDFKKQKLDQRNKGLRAIDLLFFTSLTYLNLSDNRLADINLSNNIHLTELWLNGNQIKTIDLKSNTNLIRLYLFQNQITTIDLLNNPRLQRLSLHHNQIKQLNLRTCRSLEAAYIDENLIRKLFVWYTSKLEQLALHNQRAEECNIVLLHNKVDEQRCKQWARNDIQKYNRKDDLNKHKCRYNFCLENKQ